MEPAIIRRQDRVHADVECLLCGRLIGELFGLVWRDMAGQRAARTLANLTAFRAAIPGSPVVQVRRGNRFRCSHCGGLGMIDEVTTTLVSERVPVQWSCPVHGERLQKLGRGRPPKECRCKGKLAAA